MWTTIGGTPAICDAACVAAQVAAAQAAACAANPASCAGVTVNPAYAWAYDASGNLLPGYSLVNGVPTLTGPICDAACIAAKVAA
ncbi:MAG: hypothetical protein AAB356_01635, partial [Deltaproteobacteria bacterium]